MKPRKERLSIYRIKYFYNEKKILSYHTMTVFSVYLVCSQITLHDKHHWFYTKRAQWQIKDVFSKSLTKISDLNRLNCIIV